MQRIEARQPADITEMQEWMVDLEDEGGGRDEVSRRHDDDRPQIDPGRFCD